MIGWYVHHHGSGHLHRFLAVRERMRPRPPIGLSSLPRPAEVPPDQWVQLPLDLPEGEDPTAAGTLHWVPLHVDGLRDRMAAISGWIASERPRLLVVDVSVEVALLARLHGVPTAIVLQRGVRDDAPHRLAFAQATALIAPWSAASHLPEDGPRHDRLVHVGAASRFDGRAVAPPGPEGDVLLLAGAGGLDFDPADAPAGWRVATGGEDVWPLLQSARVVVGTAGGNVVAEVAAARRPLVCVPQSRPFGEQDRQAEALRRLDLAEVTRGLPTPDVLARAARRDTARWSLLHDGRGAERLAATVSDLCA